MTRVARYTGPCGVCRAPIYAGDRLTFVTRGRARVAAHPCHVGERQGGSSSDYEPDRDGPTQKEGRA